MADSMITKTTQGFEGGDEETPPQERRVSDFSIESDQTRRSSSVGSDLNGSPVPISRRDRRLSKEWDAALTPPSRFQKVEGSIYATPASRDGGVARNKIHGFKEKVLELTGKKK